VSAARREAGPLHVLGALLVLAATLGLVEGWLRVANPPLRAQVVRSTLDTDLEDIDGVPVWTGRTHSPGRWNLSCADARPESRGVVAVGSSIFAGVSLTADQTFGTLLQARLDDQPPPGAPACVHNLSQPGFAFRQKLAVATHPPETLRPAVYLWELWSTDTADYVWLGPRAAMRVGTLRTGADGLPNPLHLPARLNRFLLRWSLTWLHVDVGLAKAGTVMGSRSWEQIVDEDLPALLDLVDAQGARLVLLTTPPLHDSFRASLAEQPEQVQLIAPIAAARDDVDLVRIEQLLVDDDVEALRLDPCCHYNAAGHRRLAEVLEPIVRRALAGEALVEASPTGDDSSGRRNSDPRGAPPPQEAP